MFTGERRVSGFPLEWKFSIACREDALVPGP